MSPNAPDLHDYATALDPLLDPATRAQITRLRLPDLAALVGEMFAALYHPEGPSHDRNPRG